MSGTTNCETCGHVSGENSPQPQTCSHCPERDCDGCGARIRGAGELTNGSGACVCWVPVNDVPVADLKAALARDGFGINTSGELHR